MIRLLRVAAPFYYVKYFFFLFSSVPVSLAEKECKTRGQPRAGRSTSTSRGLRTPSLEHAFFMLKKFLLVG